MANTLEPWSAERAREIVKSYRRLDGAALPILHAFQQAFGLSDDALQPYGVTNIDMPVTSAKVRSMKKSTTAG